MASRDKSHTNVSNHVTITLCNITEAIDYNKKYKLLSNATALGPSP